MRRENPDGSMTSEFHSKFINYIDKNDDWNEIDLSFTETDEGFSMSRAPYELIAGKLSTDNIRFVSTNQFDVYSGEVRNDRPLGKDRRFIGATTVEGEITDKGILYRDAFPSIGASLLLQPHEMEARYLVGWETRPARCDDHLEVAFEETYDEGEPRMRDGDVVPETDTPLPDGYSVRVNDFRGIGTPKGRIWDGAGKSSDIMIVGSYNDGVFRGKKIIPCDFFDGVTYPVFTDDTSTFYPDASPETNTVDGYVENFPGSTNWDTVHDGTSGDTANDAGAVMYASATKDGVNFGIRRSAALFDTSSLTGTLVTSAQVELYGAVQFGNGDNDGDDFINIVSPANLASNTAITTADFDVIGAVDSPTQVSTGIDFSSISYSSYNVWSITNLASINASGVTKYGIREGHDILDSPYAGASETQNSVGFYTSDQTGTSQDPKLVITYLRTSDLSVEKIGDAFIGSGSTVIYTITATNNGPATATGAFITDIVPSGFAFKSADSSPDCSPSGGNVVCGNFNLANGTSTGRTIAFTVATGGCNMSRLNRASVSGSVLDLSLSNNSGSFLTNISCPVIASSIRKSADETVASSTTLQSDDHLVLTLGAGKSYILEGALFATSTNANPDIKIAFTGSTISVMDIGYTSSSTTQFGRAGLLETGAASPAIPIQANEISLIQIDGTIVMNSTGSITLRWAQNTTNANATRIKQGSFLSVQEIH
jgi:uncharacterized repeat protein (TIGR01451 family)